MKLENEEMYYYCQREEAEAPILFFVLRAYELITVFTWGINNATSSYGCGVRVRTESRNGGRKRIASEVCNTTYI